VKKLNVKKKKKKKKKKKNKHQKHTPQKKKKKDRVGKGGGRGEKGGGGGGGGRRFTILSDNILIAIQCYVSLPAMKCITNKNIFSSDLKKNIYRG